MSLSFAELFEDSIINLTMTPGELVNAEVIEVTSDVVIVSAGLKSESVIPADQFLDDDRKLNVKVGDFVEVVLDTVENGFGETRLSREKAKRLQSWKYLEKAFEAKDTILGMITGKVKGGFTVELKGVRAFLPGSLVDVRPLRDTTYLEGKDIELKVIKIDAKRNNVVVSRRSVLEEESNADRETLLSSLEEGQKLKGIVKNLTDYGAFVDLGGIDGLLHITDMAWKRVKHPSEVVAIADEIDVIVLKFDREKSRVSLGLKQLDEDPWMRLIERFPVDTRITGKVTNIADYGCFVEIEEGIEGLVHVSEMDWTNKNIHPSKVVKLGDSVEVMVLDIDAERRRISLGIKQCVDNPWASFASQHNKGDKVKGNVKSITDFGLFIGLDGEIDGLVHLSDISWEDEGENSVREYTKGEELEAIILAIDPERERISLGIKQLADDPMGRFLAVNDKGTIVKGKVIELTDKGLRLELSEGVMGFIATNDISREKIASASDAFKVDDHIEAKIVSVDRKTREIILSIKAKDAEEEASALKQYNKDQSNESAVGGTLGDLLKAKIDQNDLETKE
jgi:small subunit ribosomal protein S1